MFSSHISQKCKNMQTFIETELAKRKSKLGAKIQNDWKRRDYLKSVHTTLKLP